MKLDVKDVQYLQCVQYLQHVQYLQYVQYVPSLTDLGMNPLGEISEHREAVMVTSLSAVCALLLRTAKERSPAGE